MAGLRLRSADATAFGALLQASPAPPPGAPTPVVLPSRSGQFAVTLRGVLTPAECRAVVEATERRGYGAALLNVGGGREVYSPDHRDSARVIVDSPEFADALFARVAHALPPTLESGESGGGVWRLVGLNERLRFLRYDAGQKFEAHYDGAFERGPESGALAGQRTFVTLLLYLNEGYDLLRRGRWRRRRRAGARSCRRARRGPRAHARPQDSARGAAARRRPQVRAAHRRALRPRELSGGGERTEEERTRPTNAQLHATFPRPDERRHPNSNDDDFRASN